MVGILYLYRALILYFLPQWHDYVNVEYFGFLRKVNTFTPQEFEKTSEFILITLIGALLGTLFFFYLKNNFKNKKIDLPKIHQKETLTNSKGMRFSFKYIFFISIFCTILGIYLAINFGLGIKGSTFTEEDIFFIKLIIIPVYCRVFMYYVLMTYSRNDNLWRLASVLFFFVLIASLISGLKGIIIGPFVYFLIIRRVNGKDLPKSFYKYLIYTVFFTLLFVFPISNILRTYFLSGGENTSLISFNTFSNVFEKASLRLGSFDWLNLWINKIPIDNIPIGSRSPFYEFLEVLNNLTPGSFFDFDTINPSKLMVIYGRGFGEESLFSLGGHGENAGGLATTFIYFGFKNSFFYFFLLLIFVNLLEFSKISPFFKFCIINSNIFNFLMGGGFTVFDITLWLGLIILATLYFVYLILKNTRYLI